MRIFAKTPQVRARFKGFEILSRGAHKDGEPDLFIRGKETYKANLNPDNPLGTIQSIEHVLRNLGDLAVQFVKLIGQERLPGGFPVYSETGAEHLKVLLTEPADGHRFGRREQILAF